ncbi:MAG: hypothetical protein SFZ03_01070 [Candidatus Melainabacteria bacterium]|nr:hypothetical protein [Candidatus Melainabacteria bacterium]
MKQVIQQGAFSPAAQTEMLSSSSCDAASEPAQAHSTKDQPGLSPFALRQLGFLALLLLAICALSTLQYATRKTFTAFEWPAIDMVPFFLRQADPNFLPHDFFTNASSTPNPRLVFGHFVLQLAALFHTDWYTVFFHIKLLMRFLLPVSFLIALGSAAIRLQRSSVSVTLSLLTLFAFCLLSLGNDVREWFSVAWWRPMFYFATAHSVSLLISLWAISASLLLSGWTSRLVSSVFWFFSTLLHPAIGVSSFIFYLIIQMGRASLVEKRPTAVMISALKSGSFSFGIGVLLPGLLLNVLCPVKNPLSARDFADHYTLYNHFFHYTLDAFASFNAFPWWVAALSVVLPLLLLFFSVLVWKNRPLRWLSAFFTLYYSLSLFAQYFFIQLVPVKLVAQLGPVRFTQLGYWMLALSSCLLLGSLANQYLPEAFFRKCLPKRFNWKNSWLMGAACSALLAIVLVSYGLVSRLQDKPLETIRSEKANFYQWLETQTEPKAVIAAPYSFLNSYIPMLAKRSTFLGHGFPFHEDFFNEQDDRQNLLFGVYRFKQQGKIDRPSVDRMVSYYRMQTPKDFIRISQRYPLHYVVVEISFLPKAFQSCSVSFQDSDHAIYSITALKKCVK